MKPESRYRLALNSRILEPPTVAWAKAFPAGLGGRSPPIAASDFRPTPHASPVRAACNLVMMGGLLAHRQQSDCAAFVGRRPAQLVAVFLHAMRQPALARELATETLAAAHGQESERVLRSAAARRPGSGRDRF